VSANPPIFGLVLAGGTSSRMQRDKAALHYRGRSQLDRAYELVSRYAPNTFVSVRPSQVEESARAHKPLIVDRVAGGGPIVGIRSAFAQHAGVAWLVVACDLPFLSDAALTQLLAARDPSSPATAFLSVHDGLPEPLCAVWEPAAAALLEAFQAAGGQCPRKFLRQYGATLIEPLDPHALDNVNTPKEYAEALKALGAPGP
jgi:molybdopterin-guanine dinucleotide biosynthesis protein A